MPSCDCSLHTRARVDMLRPIAALELPIDADEGVSALARRARGGREATCASYRGTIAHFDLRSARVAFTARASTSRETNAVCWRDEHVVLYAADDVVVEADARKASTNGEEEAWVSRRFRGAGDVVNGVDVDDANGLLAACDDHGEIRVYELASGALTRVMRGHEGCVTSVAFRLKRGASECVSSSTDCRAMKWDVKTKPVPAREWDARTVKSVEEYDRERARAASGGETETVMDDGARRSFNPPMLHSVAVYRGAQSDANAPGARRVAASACGDGSVLVFDVDQKPLGTKGSTSSVSSKKKNASRISAGVFREGKAECVRLGVDGVSGHTNAATCADFIPWIDRADIVLSGGADRRLIAWNWVAAAEDAAAAVVASSRRRRKINDLAFAVDARVACVADTGNALSLYALA